MVANSSSDASSVLGGKNSKLNVVRWSRKMSRMCMALTSLPRRTAGGGSLVGRGPGSLAAERHEEAAELPPGLEVGGGALPDLAAADPQRVPLQGVEHRPGLTPVRPLGEGDVHHPGRGGGVEPERPLLLLLLAAPRRQDVTGERQAHLPDLLGRQPDPLG